MDKAKHTPGPWEAVDSMTVRTPFSAGGFMVCNLPCHTPDDERRANACLIAAAPELLEALTMALPYVECSSGDECYKPGAIDKICKQIRAVIAKAEGN